MEFNSLAEKAYHILEEKIVTLELKPGKVFSESDLSERVEIGRTPLREALLKLANERLVEMIPRRGVAITEVNVSNHLALLDTRRVLDELIAKKSAKRATVEQREQLKRHAASIETAAKNNDVDEYMKIDKEIDEILAEASRNPFACEATMPLHAHCRRFWYFYNHSLDLSEPAKLHADLIRSVANGDEEKAAEASNRLIQYLVDFTRSALD